MPTNEELFNESHDIYVRFDHDESRSVLNIRLRLHPLQGQSRRIVLCADSTEHAKLLAVHLEREICRIREAALEVGYRTCRNHATKWWKT